MKTILSTAFTLLSAASAWAQSADLDENMRRYGLVDIRSLDDGILVELRYSTEDNFVGRDMYGDLERHTFCHTSPARWSRRSACSKSCIPNTRS